MVIPPEAQLEPVQAADIIAAVDGVRRAVGALAQTTPRMLSSHYEGYCNVLKVLIDTGHLVAQRGVAARACGGGERVGACFAKDRRLGAERRPLGAWPRFALGTPDLESLSSYVIRVGNMFALPAPELLRYALQQVPGVRQRKRLLAWGALNGAGPSVAVAVAGLAAVTGLADGERMSYTGLARLLRLYDRELVSPTRRWCPSCWADDAEPYDRKLWWLGMVDACPVHACLLETRCATCGWSPALAHPGRAPAPLLALRT